VKRQRFAALLLVVVLVALSLTLTACGPEAMRARGGGAGADVGNVGDPVELHGDQDSFDRIYYQTPREVDQNR
jgi:hypothetical protein